MSKAKHVLDDTLFEIKLKFMTPENRKHAEEVHRLQKHAREEQKRRDEEMKRLKGDMMNDRKEKCLEEIKESKGNELKFGANVKKFEAPPPKRG